VTGRSQTLSMDNNIGMKWSHINNILNKDKTKDEGIPSPASVEKVVTCYQIIKVQKTRI
jgi:hypothetical protein